MRLHIVLPAVLLSCACTFDNRNLGETGETGTGEGETGEPVDPAESCWTTHETGLGYLFNISVNVDSLIVHGDDGLWIEDQGMIALDTAIGDYPDALTTSQIIGEPDDLWLVRGLVWHWDGSTLTEHTEGVSSSVLRETPGGELWRVGVHDDAPDSFVLQRWNQQSWQDHPIPALDGVSEFAAGPDVLWLLEVQGKDPLRLASRVGDGDWTIEEVSIPLVGNANPKIGASDDGALFLASPMIGCAPEISIAYRDPAGTWHTGEFDTVEPAGQCEIELHVVGDVAYLRPHLDTRVWRWDGLAQPSVIGELPSYDMRLAGGGGRLVAVDSTPWPAFYELTTAPALDASLLAEFPAYGGGVSSGVSLDAMVTGSPDLLQRWDGSGWTAILPVLRPGRLLSAFIDVWAVSETEAFAIGRPGGIMILDDEIMFHLQDNGVHLTGTNEFNPTLVWGRSTNETWVLGSVADGGGRIERHDDGSWITALELVDVPVGVTGDDAQLYFIDDRAQVWAWDGVAQPTPLGAPLDQRAEAAELAVIGPADEYLIVDSHWSDLLGDPDEVYRSFVVWDGEQWDEVVERWPDGPEQSAELVGDRAGGVFVLSPEDGGTLWYGDGSSWELIEIPDAVYGGAMAAAPDGLLIVESRVFGQRTHEFRWSCPWP